jgi:hypothetical protein
MAAAAEVRLAETAAFPPLAKDDAGTPRSDRLPPSELELMSMFSVFKVGQRSTTLVNTRGGKSKVALDFLELTVTTNVTSSATTSVAKSEFVI